MNNEYKRAYENWEIDMTSTALRIKTDNRDFIPIIYSLREKWAIYPFGTHSMIYSDNLSNWYPMCAKVSGILEFDIRHKNAEERKSIKKYAYKLLKRIHKFHPDVFKTE